MRDRLGHSRRLEEWARWDSVLHRRDARAKIVAVLCVLIAIALTPPASPMVFVPAMALLSGAVYAAGLPLGGLLVRGLAIVPFPLFFGIVSWLENGNGPFAAALVLRSYISAVAVLLLMAVTPLPELLRGLRGLGVPAALVMVLQSLVRYLQVLIDDALRMQRAARCRDGGVVLVGYRQSVWKRSSGALAVLFGRSYGRAEAVHRAMTARGFRGEFVPPHPAAFTCADWVFLAGAAAAGAGVWALAGLGR